jgi:hypothetical protein
LLARINKELQHLNLGLEWYFEIGSTPLPSIMELLLVLLFLALCTSALHTSPQVFGVFRPDLSTNVEVAKLLPSDDLQPIPNSATKIQVQAHVSSTFEIDFKYIKKGKNLARSQDNKWIGCCASGLKLKGDELRGFGCCDEDEEQ